MALKFTASTSKAAIPAGFYRATLAGIDPREGVNGTFLVWRFSVKADDGEVIATAPTSTKFTSQSKAYQYTEALLGRKLSDQEEVDLQQLFGLPCRVFVIVATLDGGGTVNRVDRVLADTPDSLNDNSDVPF